MSAETRREASLREGGRGAEGGGGGERRERETGGEVEGDEAGTRGD